MTPMTPAEARSAILALDDFLRSEETKKQTLEEGLENLVLLSQLKKDLAMVYDDYSGAMIKKMAESRCTEIRLPSGTELKCKTGYSRKSWDNSGLLSAVYERLQQSSVDMDTGEVILSTEEIVSKILEYLQPSYWRVGALNNLGINADAYCEVGEPKTNIAIYSKKEARK